MKSHSWPRWTSCYGKRIKTDLVSLISTLASFAVSPLSPSHLRFFLSFFLLLPALLNLKKCRNCKIIFWKNCSDSFQEGIKPRVPSKSYENQKNFQPFSLKVLQQLKLKKSSASARPQVHIALSAPYKTSFLLHFRGLSGCSTGAPGCA